MPNQTDQQICDRVAVEIMEYELCPSSDIVVSTQASWAKDGNHVCMYDNWNPCGPSADANDTHKVIDAMLNMDGHRWCYSISSAYSTKRIMAKFWRRGLSDDSIEVVDDAWDRAVCLAALATKASETKEDGDG